MNVLPLALSISNTFTKVGAIAAFAALLGIAVLSLLVFSQAREIKRLREWAGRAPERAAEMEQRVSTDAAARIQRGPTPPMAMGARVVPRKTPLVSAPVSTAVNATASAAVPAAGAAHGDAAVAATPQADPAPVASAANASPATGEESKAEESKAEVSPQVAPHAAEGPVVEAKPDLAEEASSGVDVPAASPVASESKAPEGVAPAPATAAAVARSPLPPSPADPSPPVDPTPSAPSVAVGSTDAQAAARPAARPPAPVAAARRVPSRTVAVASAGASPRSPAPRARLTNAPREQPSSPGRAGSSSTATSGPKYFKQERSPARAVVLVVGGLIVVVLALVFAVSALKGGGSPTASTPTQSLATSEAPQSSEAHTSTQAATSNPADTTVAVLNGTGTAGLAHHLASDLQQGGYSQAAASSAVPQGTHPTTVVEYTQGHRSAAQAVARSLNVGQVQPIESSIAVLAGSAEVVVLAGADQAALLGGGAAQSQGEPAAAP